MQIWASRLLISMPTAMWDSVVSEARLVMSWSRREFQGMYRQSALRVVWSLVQPLSTYAVYVIIFHWILAVHSGGLPYLSFMVAGVTAWRYFSIGLSSCTALVDRSHVLSRVYFRREIVPLSLCVTGLIDLAVGTLAMVLLGWIQGIPPQPTLVALPLVYVSLVLYTAGTAVLLATVTVFVRDIAHAMPTVQQLLFLATPIMYSPEQIPHELSALATLNPIASLAAAIRTSVLEGRWPSASALGINIVLSASFFVGAIWYTRSIEHRVVDIV